MTVNIVTETKGAQWILWRCATEIADRMPGVQINSRKTADLTYCLPQLFVDPSRGRQMAFFTHPKPAQLSRYAPVCVAHTCMNVEVEAELRREGYNPRRIRPGAYANEPVTFGVVGHVKKSGRKGEALVDKMVRAGYRVIAHGRGWPCEHMSDDVRDLPKFYRSIDYLVIPSLVEGGPMPMVDAMGFRKPVIAPQVGWCWEFPCIQYERGNWESLRGVLEGLTSQVPTWEDWVEGHRQLFRELAA